MMRIPEALLRPVLVARNAGSGMDRSSKIESLRRRAFKPNESKTVIHPIRQIGYRFEPPEPR